MPKPLKPRLSLREALKPIVRNGLPAGRVGDVRTPAGPHARIAVKGPIRTLICVGFLGVTAEEACPAFVAKALLETAIGMAPSLDELFPLQQREGAAIDPRLCRRSRSGATLAASTVAVAREPRRLSEPKRTPPERQPPVNEGAGMAASVAHRLPLWPQGGVWTEIHEGPARDEKRATHGSLALKPY